jgi:tetratricopeptide (TPR) repeat protein
VVVVGKKKKRKVKNTYIRPPVGLVNKNLFEKIVKNQKMLLKQKEAQLNFQEKNYKLLEAEVGRFKIINQELKQASLKTDQRQFQEARMKSTLERTNKSLEEEVANKNKLISENKKKLELYQEQLKAMQEKSLNALQNYQSSDDFTLPENSNTTKSEDEVVDQFKIANTYLANEDYQQALTWYLKVAEKGYPSAQFNVGNMYYNGFGTSRDVEKAFDFYLKAAKQDFVEAQFNVGLMFSTGEGVEVDNSESLFWYQKAANQGYEKAQIIIDRFK